MTAIRAGQLGKRVACVELERAGGTCLNWGCIPTKALLAASDLLRKIREAKEFGILVGEVGYDFAAMMSRKDDIVGKMRGGVQGACERKGVAVVKGQGVVDGDAVVVDGTPYPYDHLIVATGTEPAGLPGIDMVHPAVLTSNDILVLPEVPETLLILGAGVIGCEFASLFQPLGVKVTMVEMLPLVLTTLEIVVLVALVVVRAVLKSESVSVALAATAVFTLVTKVFNTVSLVKFKVPALVLVFRAAAWSMT